MKSCLLLLLILSCVAVDALVCPPSHCVQAITGGCQAYKPYGYWTSYPNEPCPGTPCSAGRYTNTQVASSIYDCLPCDVGTYATLGWPLNACGICAPGSYSGRISGSCTLCPVGTWSNLIQQSNTTVCFGCPLGTFSVTPGLNDSSLCTSCSAGTFGDATGLTMCLNCPIGKTSDTRASSCK